jgi:hypothetical protein
MKRFLAGAIAAASLAACSASVKTAGDPQASQSAANAWAVKWCQAQPGNTKEELVATMGPPTGRSPTTMTWSAHQYQFNAFFDATGKVEQLDINTYSLSAAEKASLTCETIRTRATVARAAKKAAATPPRTLPAPCALVTAAEMSAILDAAVVANAREGGATECDYTPVSGVSPAVKLSIDWGDGKIAMASAGTMARSEPGLVSPYDGVGDQAIAVGPALMIRTGDDLMTIVFTGVSGAPAKARRIFDTAKPRM